MNFARINGKMQGTLLVDVTWEDIQSGRPDNPCYCPVAVALSRNDIIQREIHFLTRPSVGSTKLRLSGADGLEYVFEISEALQQWIATFDLFDWPDREDWHDDERWACHITEWPVQPIRLRVSLPLRRITIEE